MTFLQRCKGISLSLALGLITSLAHAAVPQQITNQGYIASKATGDALQGTKTVTFKLYAAGNETAIWEETQEVFFKAGLYSVKLGQETPIDVNTFNGKALSLGITLAGEAEFEPRLTFNSVPYAMSAQTAFNVTGPIAPHSLTINEKLIVDAEGVVRPDAVVFGSKTVIDSDGMIDAAHLPDAIADADEGEVPNRRNIYTDGL